MTAARGVYSIASLGYSVALCFAEPLWRNLIVAMSPQEVLPLAPVAAADWMFLATSGRYAGGADILLGGIGAAAVAVAWTPVSDPDAAGWRPCTALGNGRWRLESGDPGEKLRGVGIRYRLSANGPWSPVSVDRKSPAEHSLPQAPVLPVLVAAPLLAGVGKIGRPVAVVPGLWRSGVQDIALQWRRDGIAIPGATGTVYLPGPEDDGTNLTCLLRATNATGPRQVETAALFINRVAPRARGDLFDEVFDEDTGKQAVAAAQVFAGDNLCFTVAGAGAEIEPATGLVRIPTDRPISGERVVVTASNSGGMAMRDFLVTVEAIVPAPDLGSGGLVVAQAAAPPEPDPAGGRIPVMPAAMLEDALEKPLADFGDDFGTAQANNAFFGSTSSILALASWAGNTRTDRRVLAQARFSIEGEHAPTCEGGYPAQHNLQVFAMFAILRLTPRLWSAITESEKARIDLVMKAGLIATAFTSSDTNPYFLAGQKPEMNLRGRPSWRSGGPNFRCTAPATVQTARVYFGGAAAVDAILNDFDYTAFAEEVRAAGLSNVAGTFREQPPPAPTGRQIEDAVRNWANHGLGVADHQAMLVNEGRFTFNKTINTGLNDGAGVKGRGKMMAGQDGLPNRGRKGMANEFDTIDAKGKRSSASYVIHGYRVIMNWLGVEMANGTLDRRDPDVQALAAQVDIGVTDLIYKSQNGYLSYAKGGPPASNNEDWTASKQAVKWGWSYTFGIWTHVLRPYLLET